jgi:hypothetical protein
VKMSPQSEKTLDPGNNARLGETRFETWLTHAALSRFRRS